MCVWSAMARLTELRRRTLLSSVLIVFRSRVLVRRRLLAWKELRPSCEDHCNCWANFDLVFVVKCSGVDYWILSWSYFAWILSVFLQSWGALAVRATASVRNMKLLRFIYLLIYLSDVICALASWSVLSSPSAAPSDVLNHSTLAVPAIKNALVVVPIVGVKYSCSGHRRQAD